MQRDEVQRIIPEIVACLRPLEPAKVILFGSGARDQADEVADLDLIVVTGSDQMPRTYREKEAVYLQVAQALRSLRQRVPLDLIVHTQPMHERFMELDSQFARQVTQEGRLIYESHHA
jgi:uncharacterized protein